MAQKVVEHIETNVQKVVESYRRNKDKKLKKVHEQENWFDDDEDSDDSMDILSYVDQQISI